MDTPCNDRQDGTTRHQRKRQNRLVRRRWSIFLLSSFVMAIVALGLTRQAPTVLGEYLPLPHDPESAAVDQQEAPEAGQVSNEMDLMGVPTDDVTTLSLDDNVSDATSAQARRRKKKRVNIENGRIPIRLTPRVFSAALPASMKAPSADSNTIQQYTLRPRRGLIPSYVPALLERGLLLVGLALLAVMKRDATTTTTTAIVGEDKIISQLAATHEVIPKTMRRFLLSFRFEWETLLVRFHGTLPSLLSAILLAWVPRLLVASQGIWGWRWELTMLVGMPTLMSLSSTSSWLWSTALSPTFRLMLQQLPVAWTQYMALLRSFVTDKLWPTMTSMTQKMLWAEFWKFLWDYVFRPLSSPEVESSPQDESSQTATSSWSFSLQHVCNTIADTASYLWSRIQSKADKKSYILLRKSMEEQFQSSVLGLMATGVNAIDVSTEVSVSSSSLSSTASDNPRTSLNVPVRHVQF